MITYKPRSFELHELVPPDVYARRGERAWELLEPRGLVMLQAVRDALGPVIVNNWHDGGGYQESGFRNLSSSTGAAFSQHKYGRGFDCHLRDVTPSEAREYILKHPEKFPYLTTIEDTDYTPSWLHVDCRLRFVAGIVIVRP